MFFNFKQTLRFLYFSILVLLLIFISGFFFIHFDDSFRTTNYVKNSSKNKSSYSSLKKSNSIVTVNLPNLKNEIEIASVANRPDSTDSEQKFIIFLKKSKEQKLLTLNEKIYLNFKNQILSFANDVSDFWLEPQAINNDLAQLKLDLDRKKIEMDLPSYEISFEPIKPIPTDISQHCAFKILSQAKYLGLDQLTNSSQQRFLIDGPTGSYIISLSNLDLIIFKNGLWQKTIDTPDTSSFPIAILKSDKNMHWEGWDENGKYFILSSPYFGGQPLKTKMEEILKEPKLRTLKQISCLLDKDRLLLREGDWLIKNEENWQVIRADKEKETIRNQVTDKELFVFEKIVLKEGKKIIQGNLFNGTRNQNQKVEIPIQSLKQNKPKEMKSQKKLKPRGQP